MTGSADELAELARAVNTTIGKLDLAETARRDLIAAVSHDLRTPLTSLRLLAEAVGDDIVDAPTRRGYLGQMRTHIDVLSGLIDDLFELSRLEAGDIQWTLQQVSLGQLVEEAVDALRPQASGQGRQRAGRRAGAPAGAREPREGPARAVQPDPERDPPHPGRRLGDRARRGVERRAW